VPYRIEFTASAFSLLAHFPPEMKKLLREALKELQNNPALAYSSDSGQPFQSDSGQSFRWEAGQGFR